MGDHLRPLSFDTSVLAHNLSDLRFETITAPRHRLDVDGGPLSVTECLPEHRDIESDITLLDKDVRPERIEHLFLGDNRALIPDQQQERFEDFGSQRDHPAIAEQDALIHVDDKRIKLVKVSESQGHKLSL